MAIREGTGAVPQIADTVYGNGTILTMNPAQPEAEAVAVAGGVIIGVGALSDMKALCGAESRFVDLRGRTMLPGFIDAHSHFIDNAARTPWVNINSKPLGPVESIEDMLQLLGERAGRTPEGGWIVGWGYDDTMIKEMRHPTRADLDTVSTKHPIVIQHISGWVTAANSAALRLAGITRDTPDPENVVIRRSASGEPSGVIEASHCPVLALVPQLDQDQFLDTLSAGSDMYLAKGCTTAQEGWVADPNWFPLMGEALKRRTLKLRLVLYPLGQDISLEEYGRVFPDVPSGTPLDEEGKLVMGATKLSADGSIQAYTGFLSQPYHKTPEGKPGYVGYPSNDLEWLRQRIIDLHSNGRQIAVHCNGDAAIDVALDAYEEAQRQSPRDDTRFIVIHSQMARSDQIERMSRLEAIPSFFITHTYFWGDRHYAIFMGPERAVRLSPTGDALRCNLPFTLHNDTFVTPIDPLLLVWSAVNRLSYGGRDLGKAEQGIPVLEALKGITINAARQGFEEGVKGSIEPGKFADFVVLDENPLAVDPMHLKDIEIAATIVGDVLAYGAL